MKGFIKKTALLLLCAAAVLSLAACGSNKSSDSIIIGTTMQIDKACRGDYSFDMLSSGTAQPPIVSKIMNNSDGSFSYSSEYISWSSEDSKEWTINVCSGIQWSDGESICAQDIIEALQNEDSFSDMFESLTSSADGKTLTAVLKDPDPRFLSNLCSVRLLPSHAKNEDGSYKEIWYGPFVLEEYDIDSGMIIFTPNPCSNLSSSKFTKIIFRLFDNEDSMYMSLKSGDIQMVWNYSSGISTDYAGILAEDDNISLINIPSQALPMVLAFNEAKSSFSDKNLRLAVSYMLPYDKLVNIVGGSAFSTAANRGGISPVSDGYSPTAQLCEDLNKADEYMRLAGYTKDSDGIYKNASGEAFSFTLSINASNPSAISASDFIKTALEKIGVSVSLENLDKASFQAKTTNSKSGGSISFEAALMNFTSAGVSMKEGLATIYVYAFHPVQGACGVSDPDFLALLDRLSSAKTMDEYSSAAAEMQKYYAENCPFITLYYSDRVCALNKNSGLTEVYIDANFGLNNLKNWY